MENIGGGGKWGVLPRVIQPNRILTLTCRQNFFKDMKAFLFKGHTIMSILTTLSKKQNKLSLQPCATQLWQKKYLLPTGSCKKSNLAVGREILWMNVECLHDLTRSNPSDVTALGAYKHHRPNDSVASRDTVKSSQCCCVKWVLQSKLNWKVRPDWNSSKH